LTTVKVGVSYFDTIVSSLALNKKISQRCYDYTYSICGYEVKRHLTQLTIKFEQMSVSRYKLSSILKN